MHKYQLQFQSVWEQTMSDDQKKKFARIVSSLPFVENQLTTKSVIANYKENGGFVVTVLLNNGYPHSFEIHQAFVKVTNSDNVLIAEGRFKPGLTIDRHCSQPWSFVFSKEMVLHPNGALYQVNVEVFTND
ncbi:SLAP domain-containing protein [Bacillus sp. FSL K6-3431]|uniref:SLAP domain-containing protein n=1 Tax=Bacillus sp. FSL K6-3431 TaxID=2921500 RepID=UPI0030FCFCC2